MTKDKTNAGPAESADRQCWHCFQPVGGELFCPRCSKIQPLPERADYFALLGVQPEKMSLDPGGLEESFYSLSRQVHPDRFQTRSPEERRMAEERSAALNVAYRTLRDPVARSEYLLALEEGASEGSGGKPPAELLFEIMEVQEAVEAYRDSDDGSREALEESLRETLSELEERCGKIVDDINEAFIAWDRSVIAEGSEEAKGPILKRLRELLDRRRYYLTTAGDIKAALAGEPPPARHED